jgi:hypothetical protein
VVLENVSSHEVSLGGYAVDIGSNEFDFPSGLKLQPGSKVRVHTGKGTNARHDVYWGRTKYACPNEPRFFVSLYGPGGTQNGQQVVELEDTCAVLGPGGVNGPCWAGRSRSVNRWLIFVIVCGLVIGFVGILVHNGPAIALGFLLSMGGILLAARGVLRPGR